MRQSYELAAAVRGQYTRYVAFHSDFYDVEVDTLTLWTMHTHAFAAAECTPYLTVMAPTPEAGKSKIIEVARYLVRAGQVVNDPTPASLFRMIEINQPTLFVDEMDMLYESKGLKTVLNAGYRIGGYVTRAEKVRGQFVTMKFNVFCPKMFSGIAGKRLPITGATLGRCVLIPMRRKMANETVEKFFHRQARREIEPIQRELTEWAQDAVGGLEVAQALCLPLSPTASRSVGSRCLPSPSR
jgi:hypothetical protein